MDKRHIEALFLGHWQRMFAMAMSLLYDEDDSKDAVENVFLRLLNADISPEGDDEEIGRYLLMSVRNECLNTIRNKSTRQRLEHLYAKETSTNGDIYTEEDCLQRLAAFAKSRLSEQDMGIFSLRFMQGASYKDIARHYGISRVAVWKHIAAIVKTIKNEFKP